MRLSESFSVSSQDRLLSVPQFLPDIGLLIERLRRELYPDAICNGPCPPTRSVFSEALGTITLHCARPPHRALTCRPPAQNAPSEAPVVPLIQVTPPAGPAQPPNWPFLSLPLCLSPASSPTTQVPNWDEAPRTWNWDPSLGGGVHVGRSRSQWLSGTVYDCTGTSACEPGPPS